MIFALGGVEIRRGETKTVYLTLPPLYTHAPMTMPVIVMRGKRSGPTVFISAAIHGDEINGIEIIRRLRQVSSLQKLKGTLILVPVVNAHGLINMSRYTPDRRDLNRSFPGSTKGSLASRIAKIFFEEIVSRCDLGIDLHTGAIHRSNLPQIRTNIDNPFTLSLAKVFGAPVVLHSELRDGSLRSYAQESGIPILLYEGGEALRFDEASIKAGVKGIIRVLRELNMISTQARKRQISEPVVSKSSSWVRTHNSGLVRTIKGLGDKVRKGELVALVNDPIGEASYEVKAPFSGIIIGRIEIPLVQEGDALFHVARFDDLDEATERVVEFYEEESQYHGIPELSNEPEVI